MLGGDDVESHQKRIAAIASRVCRLFNFSPCESRAVNNHYLGCSFPGKARKKSFERTVQSSLRCNWASVGINSCASVGCVRLCSVFALLSSADDRP